MTKYKRWILLLTGEIAKKNQIFRVDSQCRRIFRSDQTEAIYKDSSRTKITSLRQHYVSFSHHIKRSAKREAKTEKKTTARSFEIMLVGRSHKKRNTKKKAFKLSDGRERFTALALTMEDNYLSDSFFLISLRSIDSVCRAHRKSESHLAYPCWEIF